MTEDNIISSRSETNDVAWQDGTENIRCKNRKKISAFFWFLEDRMTKAYVSLL